ncbi:MAG: DUF1538 domain-containing protein, partial [Clostridia bacterium]|nr:DUF1538 domain-containing protein [Clostridia bacterium]
LLLGMIFNITKLAPNTEELAPIIHSTTDVTKYFYTALPHYANEVFMSMLPVIAVFIIFELITRTYRLHQMLRISIGFVYTVLGLLLFLTGVNVGFAPVGSLLGKELGLSEYRLLLIPIGALIGYFIVKAEPAVQVLNSQVEEITSGMISQKMMNSALSIGVSLAVVLSMIRVVTGLNIFYILVPGYLIALVLSKFVPPIFVGIAFDSGGVASGPMTSTFLLPLAMGASIGVGGNVVTDAFGVVALVALSPLITIQLMGVIYKYRSRALSNKKEITPDTVIEFEESE